MSEVRSDTLNSGADKSWTYDAESPLTCIATSRKHPMLAIAGRNLLQVLKIGEDQFISLHRLKYPYQHLANNAANSSSTTAKVGKPCPARTCSITDVAWSDTDDTIATCSTGGDLRIWDLSRGMTQSVSFCGHNKTVNRIHFNPNSPNEIITACQDGTIKLFDIRDPQQSAKRTFYQRLTPSPPVRDVVFCPRNSVLLAAAQENGTVNIWDARQENRPHRSFQGHSCSILSVDWHPLWDQSNRNWFVTAGCRDHLIKVWDLNKPSHTLAASILHTTPAVIYSVRTNNVGQVRWRVGYNTQLISSCSLTIDLSIHLWELDRPFIPFVSFDGHTDMITSLSWSLDPDVFFSTGKDGLLMRHLFSTGSQPVRQANPVALTISSQGRVVHAVGTVDKFLNSSRVANSSNSNVQNHPTSVQFARMVSSDSGRLQPSSARKLTTTLSSTSTGSTRVGSNSDEDKKSPLGVTSTASSMISSKAFVAAGASELLESKFLLDFSLPIGSQCSVSSLLLPDVLIHLAQNYQFAGVSIDEVCEHNSSVAKLCLQDFLSQFWLTLKMIYGQVYTRSTNKYLASEGTSTTAIKRNYSEPAVADSAGVTSLCGGPGGLWSRGKLRKRTNCRRVAPKSQLPMVTNRSDFLCVQSLVNSQPINAVEVTPNESPALSAKDSKVLNGDAGDDDDDPRIPNDDDTAKCAEHSLTIGECGRCLPHQKSGANQVTGSLGEAANFLFVDQRPLTDSQVVGAAEFSKMVAVSASGSGEPENAGVDTSTDMPSAERNKASTIQACPEEAFDLRPKIDAQSTTRRFDEVPNSQKSTEKSVVRRSGSEQEDRVAGRFTRITANGLSAQTPTPPVSSNCPIGGLDLTSTLDCLQLSPSALEEVSLYPIAETDVEGDKQFLLSPGNHLVMCSSPPTVDFTHLVGPWFVQLVDAGHVQSVCTALIVLGSERTRINDWATEDQIENWFYAYLDLLARFRLWSVSTRIIKMCGNIFGGVDYHLSDRLLPSFEGHRRPVVNGPQSKDNNQLRTLLRKTSAESQPGTCTSDNWRGLNSSKPLACHVAILNQTGTSFSIRCGKCAKPMQRQAVSTSTNNDGSNIIPTTLPPTPASPLLTPAAQQNVRILPPPATSISQQQTPGIPVPVWACSRHTSAEIPVLSTCAICHLTVRGLFLWCVGCSHGGHLSHIQDWLSIRRECPAGCGHLCEYSRADGSSSAMPLFG